MLQVSNQRCDLRTSTRLSGNPHLGCQKHHILVDSLDDLSSYNFPYVLGGQTGIAAENGQVEASF